MVFQVSSGPDSINEMGNSELPTQRPIEASVETFNQPPAHPKIRYELETSQRRKVQSKSSQPSGRCVFIDVFFIFRW